MSKHPREPESLSRNLLQRGSIMYTFLHSYMAKTIVKYFRT
jgi:hypothetical protein